MIDNGSNNNKPVRIIKFLAKNTKILKAVEIFPEDRDIVLLTGKNGRGKTTILNAIWMALGGKSFIPGEPIRKGEKEAVVTLEFDEFIVTRKITEKGEYLDVRNKDGFKAPSAQSFLTSKFSEFAHNPLEFLRLKPTDQVERLRKIAPVRHNQKEIESIAGKWSRLCKSDDPLVILDNALDKIFEERTGTNREIKRLQGVIDSIKIPKDKENLETKSTIQLIAERGELEKIKRQNETKRKALKGLQTKVESHEKIIEKQDKEIVRLKELLAALELERIRTNDDLNKLYAELGQVNDEVESLKDPDNELTEKDKEIANLDKTNDIAREIISLKQQKEKAQKNLTENQSEADSFTKILDAIKAYKVKLISEANFPVTGLSIKNGQVMFNDLPIDQASGREQIEIACAICLFQHPEIGIITIDVGWSELDASGKKALREFAQKTGAQIWCTQVLDDPGIEGFHIIAGELAAVDGQMITEDIDMLA
uniref:Putative ATPase domain containing protein n=1 Tax=viral metagenome TaxID=1070528 RepID=A0A6M3JX92_9ZZZZ